MYKKTKTTTILLLFLVFSLITTIPFPLSHAQAAVELIRQRIQYGYWEVNPVIDNILSAWRIRDSELMQGIGPWAYVTQQDAINSYYLLDPDGNNIATVKPGTASSSWHLYQDRSAFGKAIPSNIKVSQNRTQIYSSAPKVGFSIGQVYLSNNQGTHWQDLGYSNFTNAMDNLVQTQTVVRYDTNATYVYRIIPYSVKVVFWTEGRAFVLPTDVTHVTVPLFKFTQEDGSWVDATIHTIQYYTVDLDFINRSFVEADEVTCQLDLSLEAPLYTSKATQLISTPDGGFKATYDNTWIGFMDLKVAKIEGGPIDTAFDVPQQVTGANVPIVANQTGSTNDPKIQYAPAPTTQTKTYKGSEQVTQPGVPLTGETANSYSKPVNDYQSEDPYANPLDRVTPASGNGFDGGTIMNQWLAYDGYGSFRKSNLIADPQTEQSYFLASPVAVGSLIGQKQNVFAIKYNTSANPFLEQEFDPRTGTFYPKTVGEITANSINTEVRSQLATADRQFSTDIALSADIPNKLDFTIGATMKPGIHTWFTNATVKYKQYHQDLRLWFEPYATGYAPPELQRQDTFNLRLIQGQEVVNVYMAYTLTFNVAMVDRYNITQYPATNQYASDELNPWIKQKMHDNYYDEYYEYNVIMPWWAPYTNNFWIGFLIGLGVILYWSYSKYNSMKKRLETAAGGKEVTGIAAAGFWKDGVGGKWGFIIKVVIALVLGVVISWLLSLVL
jgi:hypothetical protein